MGTTARWMVISAIHLLLLAARSRTWLIISGSPALFSTIPLRIWTLMLSTLVTPSFTKTSPSFNTLLRHFIIRRVPDMTSPLKSPSLMFTNRSTSQDSIIQRSSKICGSSTTMLVGPTSSPRSTRCSTSGMSRWISDTGVSLPQPRQTHKLTEMSTRIMS